jgi:hypothetical protein
MKYSFSFFSFSFIAEIKSLWSQGPENKRFLQIEKLAKIERKFFSNMDYNLRPQLAMNRFLPLWPHRFLHFGFIHLGGGGVGGL